MASLDVEALLEVTEKQPTTQHPDLVDDRRSSEGASKNRSGSSRDRDAARGDHHARDRDVRDRRHSDRRDTEAIRSESGSSSGRLAPRDGYDDPRGYRHSQRDGDYYRSSGRSSTRSRSPRRYHSRDDRSYRDHREYRDHRDPRDYRDHRDHRDRRDHRDSRDRRERHDRRDYDDRPDRRFSEQTRNHAEGRGREAALNEDERDRRTVFVQQLANRLRTEKLKQFFVEHVGSVNEAQIVKDRISGRSKGVGYVEFKDEESVQKALQLTGRLLEGIPIIVRVTEAEKNRQVKKADESGGNSGSAPFHRLYIGNIHFNVTQEDLEAVFEPFGELDFAQLQVDENKRSKGFGFVQYRDAANAREALEKMNGFELAGRPIRVGLGNDRFGVEAGRNHGPNVNFQGSAFSGAGGRGPASAFDRVGRDGERNGGGGALDDSDVAGVNFNNYSRDALMRKLARTDEMSNGKENPQITKPKPEARTLPVNVNMASRCVILRNMFDPEEEERESWVKELEDDIRNEAERQYGHVVHISVDANSKGDVYLKFDKVQGGENAIKGLNGRYFGGRMINASPVVDAVYSSLFSRARAI